MENNLDLFPNGEFVIDLGEGKKIAGKFGTWSNERMCEKFGVETYNDVVTRLHKMAIKDLVTFIYCPVEYKYRKTLDQIPYTLEDAKEWIDAIGGMYSTNMVRLMTHNSITVGIIPQEDTEDESKKKSNGTIYSEPATLPE